MRRALDLIYTCSCAASPRKGSGVVAGAGRRDELAEAEPRAGIGAGTAARGEGDAGQAAAAAAKPAASRAVFAVHSAHGRTGTPWSDNDVRVAVRRMTVSRHHEYRALTSQGVLTTRKTRI